MGTSKCFLFMRILILTTMAISVAMNVAIIGALVTKRDCKFAQLMRLPGIFLVLFVLLCFDFSIYLAFNLLWPARTSVDEKICSQVLLENGHDYKVGNKRNPLTDHLLGEFEDTIKMVGIGHDPVLASECETTLQEQVMVFDQQHETFDIGETPLSKKSKDHLGQTVGKETPVSEALHVDTTDSVSCHDSLFLSEHECNARNLILPYRQASTSESHSVKNMLAMINYLAVEGFANGEVVRDAVSTALSQQVAELISIRRKEINDTVRFCNEYASRMKSKVRVFFPSHHQFAGILDDFWGNLFDLHGKLTEKGNAIRLDLLIGMDVEEIKSCPCYFDVLPRGNNMCPEHGNCTLPAVVAFRKRIMDSFLTEDPSLLKDEEVSYFAMENDQVQYEFPIGMGSPLEELNKMEVLVQKCPSQQVAQQASKTNVYFSYNELKGLLLTSFRACILNVSHIKKADWLIDNRGGYDEKLVGLAAEMVIFGDIHPSGVFCPNAVVDPDGKIFNLCTSTLGCGDGCMWLPTLLISFGVWCISRIFEVLLSAKEPLLFGKYSRVLNRLQKTLHSAWKEISRLRDNVSTKRSRLQLQKQKLKLFAILRGQMSYLEDWSHIEKHHSSALSAAIKALKASTLRLPVVDGAKADAQAVKEAVNSAVDVMHTMTSSICNLLSKVEGTSSVVSELAKLATQEQMLLDQSKDLLSTVAAIHVKNCSLQTHGEAEGASREGRRAEAEARAGSCDRRP